MTSIHFVVHPLPGTEDQLNDRYFVAACRKEPLKSIFTGWLRCIVFVLAFVENDGTVMCLDWVFI